MTHGEYETTSPQVGGSGSVQGVQVCSRERVRKEDPRVRTDNARGILSMQCARCARCARYASAARRHQATHYGPRFLSKNKRVRGTTPCRYHVYDLRGCIHEVMHVILDDSAQIRATLTIIQLVSVLRLPFGSACSSSFRQYLTRRPLLEHVL